MSTIITAPEAIEPANTLTAPTVHGSEDEWGAILNEQTFVTLLAYVLWLHARTPEEPIDPNDFATAAQGALADTAVQPARSVATQHSLTGGGDLSSDRTLALVNDAETPGANKVYGTNASGVRGWKDDPAGGGGGGDIALADGLVVVKHGATAGTTRPAAGSVYWQGSVAPTNRAVGDWWLNTSVYD